MRTDRTRLERIVVSICILGIAAAFATTCTSCVPEDEQQQATPMHVPGPTPSGRQKGNVPPKITKKHVPPV